MGTSSTSVMPRATRYAETGPSVIGPRAQARRAARRRHTSAPATSTRPSSPRIAPDEEHPPLEGVAGAFWYAQTSGTPSFHGTASAAVGSAPVRAQQAGGAGTVA